MIPVEIIGMGISPDDLTERLRDVIRRADILVGAGRHLAAFSDVPARKEDLDRDLKKTAGNIRRWMNDRRVIVLASGDPLFFGIGSYLINALGADNVVVHPNVSSVAAAFARIKVPWHDAVILSLHGRRGYGQLFDALRQSAPVAVLTDPDNHPGRLARLCLDHRLADLEMCVLERLGTDKERCRWVDLPRAVRMRFAQPNLVVFRRIPENGPAKRPLHLGMPEDCYLHDHGVITKSEVRSVTLARLQLADSLVLWDLGSGSGSIAVEASLFIRKGRIIAVEKDARRVEQIRRNGRRFGVSNLKVVHADLSDQMSSLPRPDRVFIGGGGKRLRKILRTAAGFLKPDGILVVNTVLISSLEAAASELERLGFDPNVVQVQINRSRRMPWGSRLEAENPIWIISGRRPPKADAEPISQRRKE
jgi:precorrin-6Y C5,15-methyltransferase (decarboxylating)